MNKEQSVEILQQVHSLLLTIKTLEDKIYTLQNEITEIKQLDNSSKIEREKFIEHRIGIKPKKPKYTLDFSKNKQNKAIYKSQLELYMRQLARASNEYKDYCIQKKDRCMAPLVEQIQYSQLELNEARFALDKYDVLPNELKSLYEIDRMLEFFSQQRVDTLKEAINLCFMEIKIEELAYETKIDIEQEILEMQDDIEFQLDEIEDTIKEYSTSYFDDTDQD